MKRFGSVLAIVCAVTGCEQHDYGVQVDEPGTNYAIKNFPETISARFDISIDVAFQRNNFGEDVSRCQFQVALYYYYQTDLLGDGGGDHPHIEFPHETGACVMTELPGPPEEGEFDNNWRLRGSIDAGERIYLHGDTHELELTRVEDFGDRIYYDIEDCDEDTFPFADVFDLDAPEANMGSDFEALYLENAIVTSPKLTVTSPDGAMMENGILYHPNTESFEMAWEEEGSVPSLGQENYIHHEKQIFMRNSHKGQHHPFEAMACRPSSDTHMVVSTDTLQQLTPNEGVSDESYYTAIQVDSQTIAPESETPWGQLVHSRAVVTDGGLLHLYEDPSDE